MYCCHKVIAIQGVIKRHHSAGLLIHHTYKILRIQINTYYIILLGLCPQNIMFSFFSSSMKLLDTPAQLYKKFYNCCP